MYIVDVNVKDDKNLKNLFIKSLEECDNFCFVIDNEFVTEDIIKKYKNIKFVFLKREEYNDNVFVDKKSSFSKIIKRKSLESLPNDIFEAVKIIKEYTHKNKIYFFEKSLILINNKIPLYCLFLETNNTQFLENYKIKKFIFRPYN